MRRSHLPNLVTFAGASEAHKPDVIGVRFDGVTCLGLVPLEALQAACPVFPPRSLPAADVVELSKVIVCEPTQIEDDLFAVLSKRFREGRPIPSRAEMLAFYFKGRGFADAVMGIDWPEAAE